MKKELIWFKLAAFASAGWIASGAVHEAGHALVAMIAGLKIVEFQPWLFIGPVHVRFVGETTHTWRAIFDISGMLLSVVLAITAVVFATFLTRRWQPARLAIWFFLPFMCQCLAWLTLPLASMLGASAPGDDVTKFMLTTGWSPWTVSVIGFALALWCAQTLIWSCRKQKANKRVELASLRSAAHV